MLVRVTILVEVEGRCSRRRKHRNALVPGDDGNNSNAGPLTIVPYPQIRLSMPKEERRKAGLVTPPLDPTSNPTISSRSPSIASCFHFRRERQREMDAGAVPLDDDNATLPPSYEQVFQAGGFSTGLSSSEVHHPDSMRPIASVMQTTAK
ncbi:hypothetical protein PM082_003587 [Marasmius tenuissimus]|nr:hypothetical protein PM082_003587 [Marasmius tenuissimus]